MSNLYFHYSVKKEKNYFGRFFVVLRLKHQKYDSILLILIIKIRIDKSGYLIYSMSLFYNIFCVFENIMNSLTDKVNDE